MDTHHIVDVGVFLAPDSLLAGQGGAQGLLFLGQLGVHDLAHVRPALGLPARLELARPVGVGRMVVLDVNRRRGALEDVQLLGHCAQSRDGLDCGRPGADDAHDFVFQTRQVVPGVGIVPARGVEGVALKGLHACDPGQLGLGQGAVGADHKPRPHVVAPVGRDMPQSFLRVPYGGGDGSLEHGQLVQVVLLGNGLTVGEDFIAFGEAALGHIVHLVEQRQVVVRRHVAGDARVAVPVPGAAHIGAALDNADTLDAVLAQPGRGQQGREAAADEQTFDRIVDRLAGLECAAVGVVLVLGQRPGQVGGILGRALGPVVEPQVALFGEFLLDGVVILLGLGRGRRPAQGVNQGFIENIGRVTHASLLCPGGRDDRLSPYHLRRSGKRG